MLLSSNKGICKERQLLGNNENAARIFCTVSQQRYSVVFCSNEELISCMLSTVKVCNLQCTNGIHHFLREQLSIKQEMKLSDSLLLTKKEKKQGRDLSECHKKKKRKQRSPAKVFTAKLKLFIYRTQYI